MNERASVPARIATFVLNRNRRFASWCRIALARATGARIGANCSLGKSCDVQLGSTPARQGLVKLGPSCNLAQGVVLQPYGGTIALGRHVHLGEHTVIYGHGGVEIGDECLIAMQCRILSSEHTVSPPGICIRTQPDRLKRTRLGRDVWLGAGVTVLGGVTIGEGCIVGAGAVVTSDLPPFSIAYGVPAIIRGQRQ